MSAIIPTGIQISIIISNTNSLLSSTSTIVQDNCSIPVLEEGTSSSSTAGILSSSLGGSSSSSNLYSSSLLSSSLFSSSLGSSSLSSSSSSSISTQSFLVVPLLSFVDQSGCPYATSYDYGFGSECYWLHAITLFSANLQFRTQGTPLMQGNWSKLVDYFARSELGSSMCPNTTIYPLSAGGSKSISITASFLINNICTVFVDVNSGIDQHGRGSLNVPVKTLLFALNNITRIYCTPVQNATIVLRQGIYRFHSPIQFTNLDAQLSIIGYPGEIVNVTGTTLITNLVFTPVSGTTYFSTPLPSSVKTDPFSLNEIYLVDGTRLIRARYPNGDEYNVNDLMGISSSWMPISWTGISVLPTPNNGYSRSNSYGWVNYYQGQASVFALNQSAWGTFSQPGVTQYTAPFSHLLNWTDYTNAYLHSEECSGWGVVQFHIVAIDYTSQQFTFDVGGFQQQRLCGASLGGSIFLDNILQELDTTNEWYYSSITNLLYVGSIPNINLLELSQTSDIFILNSTSQITIQGINFMRTSNTFMTPHIANGAGDWAATLNGAIRVINSTNVTIQYNLFTYTGGPAISIQLSSNDTLIQYNEFSTLGDGGVNVIGTLINNTGLTEITQPWRTRVNNNLFYNIGRIQKQSGAMLSTYAYSTIFENNLVLETPRSSINIQDGFAGGHVIRNNLFMTPCRETADCGAINTWNRVSYQTNISGTPSYETSNITFNRNIVLGYNYGSNAYTLDNDDGSYNIVDYENVYLINGFTKAFEGGNTYHHNNLYLNGVQCLQPISSAVLYWYNNTCQYMTLINGGTNTPPDTISYSNSYYSMNDYTYTSESGSFQTTVSSVGYPYNKYWIQDMFNLTCTNQCPTGDTLPQCSNPSYAFTPGTSWTPYFYTPSNVLIYKTAQTANSLTLLFTARNSPSSFQYQVGTGSYTTISIVSDTNYATATLSSLTSGQSYTISVTATNTFGTSGVASQTFTVNDVYLSLPWSTLTYNPNTVGSIGLFEQPTQNTFVLTSLGGNWFPGDYEGLFVFQDNIDTIVSSTVTGFISSWSEFYPSSYSGVGVFYANSTDTILTTTAYAQYEPNGPFWYHDDGQFPGQSGPYVYSQYWVRASVLNNQVTFSYALPSSTTLSWITIIVYSIAPSTTGILGFMLSPFSGQANTPWSATITNVSFSTPVSAILPVSSSSGGGVSSLSRPLSSSSSSHYSEAGWVYGMVNQDNDIGNGFVFPGNVTVLNNNTLIIEGSGAIVSTAPFNTSFVYWSQPVVASDFSITMTNINSFSFNNNEYGVNVGCMAVASLTPHYVSGGDSTPNTISGSTYFNEQNGQYAAGFITFPGSNNFNGFSGGSNLPYSCSIVQSFSSNTMIVTMNAYESGYGQSPYSHELTNVACSPCYIGFFVNGNDPVNAVTVNITATISFAPVVLPGSSSSGISSSLLSSSIIPSSSPPISSSSSRFQSPEWVYGMINQDNDIGNGFVYPGMFSIQNNNTMSITGSGVTSEPPFNTSFVYWSQALTGNFSLNMTLNSFSLSNSNTIPLINVGCLATTSLTPHYVSGGDSTPNSISASASYQCSGDGLYASSFITYPGSNNFDGNNQGAQYTFSCSVVQSVLDNSLIVTKSFYSDGTLETYSQTNVACSPCYVGFIINGNDPINTATANITIGEFTTN